MCEDNHWFEQMLFASPHALTRRAMADLLLVGVPTIVFHRTEL
jgi:hypothetical protein